jgi:hypothetical protein
MNMRTLSLAALTVLDVPPPEQVRIAAQTGFTHVGLRLLPPRRPILTTICSAIPRPFAQPSLR